MADFIPVDSAYTFTQDLRYFKANDPYYFQVDNIPLKQLQENCLWIKDQLGSNNTLTKVNREDFEELKPFVNGDDRVVRVNPGRFSARINDAYNLEPLQKLTQIAGDYDGNSPADRIKEMDEWVALTKNNPDISAIYERFTSIVSTNVLNMNGLTERAFTYPVFSSYSSAGQSSRITLKNGHSIHLSFDQLDGTESPIYPLSEILGWGVGFSNDLDYRVGVWNSTHELTQLNRVENEFIKRWRGVFRTSIVDVAEELQITIPSYDAEEFFYHDSEGNKTLIPGVSNRIDLVFIYSKPIDSSETTVASYQNDGTPTTITKPQLGIALGAGVGISTSGLYPFRRSLTNTEKDHDPIPGFHDAGSSPREGTKMLMNPSDVLDLDNGFSGLNIHGSFPSPDDLMTLSPAINEALESTRFDLVGQSILPVAYIVTTENQGSLINTSLIDIRPFFRTTELAYNERAGIAAAYPQLSIANPAVGKALLDLKVKETYDILNGEISVVKNAQSITKNTPYVVGTGYIFGGFDYGVEGAYVDILKKEVLTGRNYDDIKKEVSRRMGLQNTGVQIPSVPDWDEAKWVTASKLNAYEVMDWVNIWEAPWANKAFEGLDYGSFSQNDQITLGENGSKLTELGDANTKVGFNFVKKTITIANYDSLIKDGTYVVDARFHGCVPISNPAHYYRGHHDMLGGAQGIWVEQHDGGRKFTIYVAWSMEQSEGVPPKKLKDNRSNGSLRSGFCVINNETMKLSWDDDSVKRAGCTYPTISYTITKVPTSASFGNSSTITLK